MASTMPADTSRNALHERDPNVAPAPPAQQPNGKKRKATKEPVDDQVSAYINADVAHIDCDGMPIDESCDQVRRKLNRLFDGGMMTKTAFSNDIGVSTKSLGDFLRQHGRDKGACSDSFQGAWEWFRKREMMGLKMPTKKQQKTGASSKDNSTTATAKNKSDPGNADISNISLPNEEHDGVPVYCTCDEIRTKISAHLAKGNTVAAFLRALREQLHSPSAPKLQSNMLTTFRGKKGPLAGCTSSIFYAAYVYFEKLRIAEGKAKGAFRTEMEKVWGAAGVNREHDQSKPLWCGPGERPYFDKYGQLHFT